MIDNNPTPRKSSPSPLRGANLRIPETLTSEFIRKVEELPESVKNRYLKTQLLTKFVSDDTDPAEVRRERAIAKWLATEERNAVTNERLLLTVDQFMILPDVDFLSFVNWTQTLIVDTIGDVPPYDCLLGKFSGGASTSRARKTGHPSGKYLGKAHATQPALELFDQLMEEMPGWAAFGDKLDIQLVPGNVLFTVPKKTDIDRCACKEPDINMFLQKGIGAYFRNCLRKRGINLNDQTINQNLARRGSIDGSLATLDLSAASDSVTTALVQLLLPECWHTLLAATRCEVTFVDGQEHRNEMFSSMGNGFTFELETLIFWALSKATAYFSGVSGRISVYGDDMIVPTAIAEDLMWVLHWFGFEVNSDKSFWVGSFRESCGGHYDNGVPITPFYLRKPMTYLTDVIHMANQLRLWASLDQFGGVICDYGPENPNQLWEIWSWLASMVPTEFWGGREYGNPHRLVSPHGARRQLVPETGKPKSTGEGGYLFWLNLTYDRSFQTCVETSTRMPNPAVKYRSRAVREEIVTQLPTVFRQELG